MRIALQLEGIFLVFKTKNLNDEEIAEPGGYDILYLTPVLIPETQIVRLGLSRNMRCWILMGKFSYIPNVRL